MKGLHAEYLVDRDGKRKAVVISVSEWEQILDALEEFEDIRAYDDAGQNPSEAIPFEQAVSEIDEGIVD